MSDAVQPVVPLTVASRHPSAPESESPYVLSYFAQRRAAGYIGIALPVVVLVNDLCTRSCIPSSISGSYFTGARNYFVGSLCGVGIFLISAMGYREDRRWSYFAGAMAFLVAFCPTTPDGGCSIPGQEPPFVHSDVIHTSAAIALFGTFAVFCLFLFTRTTGQKTQRLRRSVLPRQKRKRNNVFIVCGLIMIIAMATYGIWTAISHYGVWKPSHLLFAIEWICLWSFGAAWLVKGQQIFKDLPDSSSGVLWQAPPKTST